MQIFDLAPPTMNRTVPLVNSIRAHQQDISILLFFAAGLMGMVSQAIHPLNTGGEMLNLATGIAQHGRLENPFAVMQTGSTAANPPLYPLVLGGLLKVLSSKILVLQLAIAISVLANAATASLLLRVSTIFYCDLIPGVIASLLWLATMQNIAYWDTSLTVAGLLAFCVFTSQLFQPNRANQAMTAVTAGIFAGLLALLNPSTLLISVPWLGFRCRRVGIRAFVKPVLAVLMTLVVFVGGWCVRNYFQLGGFVMRTNLGMTLYASNNDCAQSSMFRDQLNSCYQRHHPNVSIEEARLLMKMGEVRYDRMRIADTRVWIQANPMRFLKLTGQRVVEFWFPAVEAAPAGPTPFADYGLSPEVVANWVRQQNFISYGIWIIMALSIPGLYLMVRRCEPVTMFFVIVLAIYPLMYYVVVSDIRYRYPVLWLSLLAAGYFVGAIGEGNLWRKTNRGLQTGILYSSP